MQQRFGNRADTKYESVLPEIPSDLCYDTSAHQKGQEMFTLEPAAPNLNANYGNYREELRVSSQTHPVMPPYQVASFHFKTIDSPYFPSFLLKG